MKFGRRISWALPVLVVGLYWGLLAAFAGEITANQLMYGGAILLLSQIKQPFLPLGTRPLDFFLPILLTGVLYDSQRYWGEAVPHIAGPYELEKRVVRSPFAERHPDLKRVVRSASPPCPRLHCGGGLSDVYRRLHTSGGIFHAPDLFRYQLRVDAFPHALVGARRRVVLPCRQRSGFCDMVPLPSRSSLVCGYVWAGHDPCRRTDEPGSDGPFRRIVRDQLLHWDVRCRVQPVRRHPPPSTFPIRSCPSFSR